MEIAQELELCLKNAILEGKLKDATETLEQIVEYFGTVEFEVKQRDSRNIDMQTGSYNQKDYQNSNRYHMNPQVYDGIREGNGIDFSPTDIYSARRQERSDSNRVGLDKAQISGQYRNIPYQYRSQIPSNTPNTYNPLAQPNAQYTQPNPQYIQPNPQYTQPNAQYTQPNPQYIQPNPQYIQPNPVYSQPIPIYIQPNPVYSQPIPIYNQPNPAYPPSNQRYPQHIPQYIQSNHQYTNPNPIYSNPIPQIPNPTYNYSNTTPAHSPQVSHTSQAFGAPSHVNPHSLEGAIPLPPSSQAQGKIHSIKLFSNLKK
jgi:hypothetical protein